MESLLNTAKQFLSITETATQKDIEIETLIRAGMLELQRAGIDIKYNYNEEEKTYNNLVITAIMMYVKSNFGNVDIKEKELSQRTFNLIEQSLSLSTGYKESEQ